MQKLYSSFTTKNQVIKKIKFCRVKSHNIQSEAFFQLGIRIFLESVFYLKAYFKCIADVDIHLYSQLLLVNIKLRIRVMSSPWSNWPTMRCLILQTISLSLILLILFYCNMKYLRNNKSIYLSIIYRLLIKTINFI